MLMKMLLARMSLGAWLTIVGFLVFLLGVFLELVKLMNYLSQHVAEIVLLIGAGVLALGLLLMVLRSRRRGGEQDLPYY